MPPAAEIIDIAFKRHADELRASWQVRLLRGALFDIGGVLVPRSIVGACMLSVCAHNFDDAVPVLLAVAFPKNRGLGTPLLCSAAKIARTGEVMADFVDKNGVRHKNQMLFKDERAMESAFRKLADEAKLSDADRVELFDAVRRWVVCDYRLDPTMNPADPDAKRLTDDATMSRPTVH